MSENKMREFLLTTEHIQFRGILSSVPPLLGLPHSRRQFGLKDQDEVKFIEHQTQYLRPGCCPRAHLQHQWQHKEQFYCPPLEVSVFVQFRSLTHSKKYHRRRIKGKEELRCLLLRNHCRFDGSCFVSGSGSSSSRRRTRSLQHVGERCVSARLPIVYWQHATFKWKLWLGFMTEKHIPSLKCDSDFFVTLRRQHGHVSVTLEQFALAVKIAISKRIVPCSPSSAFFMALVWCIRRVWYLDPQHQPTDPQLGRRPHWGSPTQEPRGQRGRHRSVSMRSAGALRHVYHSNKPNTAAVSVQTTPSVLSEPRQRPPHVTEGMCLRFLSARSYELLLYVFNGLLKIIYHVTGFITWRK
ncbi:uncharacterized protein LOC113057469 [Carassius auratus]|uniref:Uncharacterized protein LOC113057469 n=1 Tax=Carassius auratus TaxID=7957 RepID=A0A6P6LBR6_CARAU|nr:uncharacterized protein LOC113057469 [Carassius auratus]